MKKREKKPLIKIFGVSVKRNESCILRINKYQNFSIFVNSVVCTEEVRIHIFVQAAYC